jgi:hypothetical protein
MSARSTVSGLTTPLPCQPSGEHPPLSEAAWDEMYDAFVAYAKQEGLELARYERPSLFKDKGTRAIWEQWKSEWTALVYSKQRTTH